jgi:WD40 repeat protein
VIDETASGRGGVGPRRRLDRRTMVAGALLAVVAALAALQGAGARAVGAPGEVVTARLAAGPDLRLLHTIAAQAEPISAVAFAPDGEHLATASGAGVRLWRVSTGRQEGALAPRRNASASPVTVLAYARLGEAIAAGRRDGAVSLWETGRARELLTVPAAGSPVTGLALAPNGRAMVVARADGVLALLDPPTARPASTFGVSGLRPPRVAFSPAGDQIAWSDSDGTLRLRGVGGGGAVRVLGQITPVSRIVFSPDGTKLAVGVDHAVHVWDLATSDARRTFQHPSAVAGLAFSGDGAALTAAGDDGSATTWEVATGRELRTARFPGSTTATLAVSPTALVVAAVNRRNGRHVVELWGDEGRR